LCSWRHSEALSTIYKFLFYTYTVLGTGTTNPIPPASRLRRYNHTHTHSLTSRDMTIWRIVVNFMLPPPLILTALLVLPTPRQVRMLSEGFVGSFVINFSMAWMFMLPRRSVQKALVALAKNVLFFQVAGGFKLVHFMIFVTGCMLLGRQT
jgi:hypothetical protein